MRSWPATLITQPSGARLPFRITSPPVALSGLSSGLTTTWPGVSRASARLLADRLAADGHGAGVQQARVQQALRDQADAARLVEVVGHVAAARLQVGAAAACAR